MKPLFTVHAGEFLVDCEIQRKFPHVNVWVPTKDTGIDLLVSNHDNTATISLQVKFSRDYLVTNMKHVEKLPDAASDETLMRQVDSKQCDTRGRDSLSQCLS